MNLSADIGVHAGGQPVLSSGVSSYLDPGGVSHRVCI